MKGVDQRICRHPDERWRWRMFQIVSGGTAEQHDFPARTQERLKCIECPGFNTNGPNGHDIECFVKLRTWKELFEAGGFNFGIPKAKFAHRFAEEYRLACFNLDHPKSKTVGRELERNCRRSAAGARVEHGAGVVWYIARGNDWLNQQPIDRRIVSFRREPEGRQINLGVPLG